MEAIKAHLFDILQDLETPHAQRSYTWFAIVYVCMVAINSQRCILLTGTWAFSRHYVSASFSNLDKMIDVQT